MTKYDYHPKDKNWLSHDGKTYSYPLFACFNQSENERLIEIGDKDYLTGKALVRYNLIK